MIVIVMNNQYTMIYVNFDWDLCYLLIYYYNSIFAVLYTMHIRTYTHTYIYIYTYIYMYILVYGYRDVLDR